MRIGQLIRLSLGSALAMGAIAPALGATVTNINTTITNSGNCTSVTGCPENYSVYNYAGSTTQVVSVPPNASFGFTDSFNQGSNLSTGSNLVIRQPAAEHPGIFRTISYSIRPARPFRQRRLLY